MTHTTPTPTTTRTEDLGGLFTEPVQLTGHAAFEATRGPSGDPVEYLRNWHDETHTGPFHLCLEGPCYGLQQLL